MKKNDMFYLPLALYNHNLSQVSLMNCRPTVSSLIISDSCAGFQGTKFRGSRIQIPDFFFFPNLVLIKVQFPLMSTPQWKCNSSACVLIALLEARQREVEQQYCSCTLLFLLLLLVISVSIRNIHIYGVIIFSTLIILDV